MTLKLLQDTIALLLREMPFYGYVLVQARKGIDDRIRYIGTRLSRGSIELVFNPENFGRLSIGERIAMLEHEVIHLIALHPLRKGSRKAYIWNVASDIAANQFVSRLLPGSLVAEDFGFERDQSAERYYDLLSADENWMDDAYRRSRWSGRGGGAKTDWCSPPGEDVDAVSSDETLAAKDQLVSWFEQMHPYWTERLSLTEELVQAIIRQAVKDALEKSRGAVPGCVLELVESLVRGGTNWRAVLRGFVMRAKRISREASWTKPNRRYPGMPGFRKKGRLRICVAVDTSGSISERELALFSSEIERISRHSDEVVVVECDAAIQRIYRFDGSIPSKRDFAGRRGTDFRPVFEWAEAQRSGFDCIIYLTDGYGEAPRRSSIPTLWALTGGGKSPADWGAKVILREI